MASDRGTVVDRGSPRYRGSLWSRGSPPGIDAANGILAAHAIGATHGIGAACGVGASHCIGANMHGFRAFRRIGAGHGVGAVLGSGLPGRADDVKYNTTSVLPRRSTRAWARSSSAPKASTDEGNSEHFAAASDAPSPNMLEKHFIIHQSHTSICLTRARPAAGARVCHIGRFAQAWGRPCAGRCSTANRHRRWMKLREPPEYRVVETDGAGRHRR